eukprot:140429-Prymnesium_polylepis.1
MAATRIKIAESARILLLTPRARAPDIPPASIRAGWGGPDGMWPGRVRRRYAAARGGCRRRAADGSACSGPSLPASAAEVIPSLFARPVNLRARRYGLTTDP